MKKSIGLFLGLTIVLVLAFSFYGNAQQKKSNKKSKDQVKGGIAKKDAGYDVFLIAGQSNTHAGVPLDSILDASDPDIFQLGRFDSSDHKIIQAKENLQHWTRVEGNIGFALTFAKLYKPTLAGTKRKILIVPCGHGSTSIAQWQKGGKLYNDAIERVKFSLNMPGSKLVGILWHQGENDLGKNNTTYQPQLDTLITNMRADLETPLLPFIVGGLVPYVVNKPGYSHRLLIQEIIRNTPNRLPKTGYADPDKPFKIEKPRNDLNESHFDATGIREMGKRYFEVFISLK